MIKYVVLSIVFFGFSIHAYSQDIITPKFGKDIEAKHIEVGKTEIKYQMFESSNDTVLSIPKSDVLIISYEDGTKEVLFKQKSITEGSEQTNVTTDTAKNEAKKEETATITLSTGEDIPATVLEINNTAIVYKPMNVLVDTVLTIPKSDVLIISYADGSKELIYKQTKVGNKIKEAAENDLKSNSEETVKLSRTELRDKGTEDARLSYRGRRSGAVWTAVTSFVLTPVVGIIPAVVCAASIPRDRNLDFPDNELKKDYDYNQAYVKEARKTKVIRVLAGYVVGSVTWLAVFYW